MYLTIRRFNAMKQAHPAKADATPIDEGTVGIVTLLYKVCRVGCPSYDLAGVKLHRACCSLPIPAANPTHRSVRIEFSSCHSRCSAATPHAKAYPSAPGLLRPMRTVQRLIMWDSRCEELSPGQATLALPAQSRKPGEVYGFGALAG